MISVIITTYKRPAEIVARALESVLRQTCPASEIIVVDDSPADFPGRDDVADLIRQKSFAYEKEIRYIRHDVNRGACAARNTGLRHAGCDFVAFLDDDDEWLPEKLEKQVSLMQRENVALVYCDANVQNDKTGERFRRGQKCCRGNVFDELILQNFIGSTSYPLIRKSALEEIGGFDESLQSGQDFDVWLRIAQKYPVDYVDEPLVIYHWHEGEQITKNPRKRLAGLTAINRKHAAYLAAHPGAYWERYSKLIPFYVACRMRGKALAVWFACVRKKPLYLKKNLRMLRNCFRKK